MPRKSTINLIVFILLSVFLIMSMFLVILGVGAYRSVETAGDKTDELRISRGYIVNKLRAFDADGGINEETRDGIHMLVLTNADEPGFETLIYLYNGYLYEMFKFAESEIGYEFGTRIMALDRFEFAVEDGKFRCDMGIGAADESAFTLKLMCGGKEDAA